ncbi:MAG: hypothetical protein EON58_01275 [Alphaproteobacteria bacterium]|nr:MAG: hypothetical protein EON58_01275 [Alphaproteobacteria bacterium]
MEETTSMTPTAVAKAAFALGVPYGLFITAVYLKAFWEPVGLNPFQHSSPADLLASGAASLTLMWAGLAGGMATGAWLGSRLPQSEHGPKWLLPTIFGLAAAGLLGAVVYFIVKKNPLQWLAVGLLLHVIAVSALAYSPWINKWLQSPLVVAIVSAMLIYIPCAMLYYGSSQIVRLTSLENGRVIDANYSDVRVDTKETFLYVGNLGDSHVIYSPETSSTLLISKDHQISFFLKRRARLSSEREPPLTPSK